MSISKRDWERQQRRAKELAKTWEADGFKPTEAGKIAVGDVVIRPTNNAPCVVTAHRLIAEGAMVEMEAGWGKIVIGAEEQIHTKRQEPAPKPKGRPKKEAQAA